MMADEILKWRKKQWQTKNGKEYKVLTINITNKCRETKDK